MEKIFKWIKKNMGLFIVLLLTFILFVGNSSGTYGNRLDGINDVVISSETYDGVEKEIMDSGVVESASTRLQGKIVYTTIVLKSDTSLNKAKEIASLTLDNYSEEELSFYDFSYFLKWTKDEEEIVVTGNKHHKLDKISWLKG